MKAQLIKPVKYDLSSCSSVFTPISSISETEILSGKYPVKFYRIPDTTGKWNFTGYRILVSGSGTSLIIRDLIIRSTTATSTATFLETK